MRLGWLLAWLAGLALACLASWWIWRSAPITEEAYLFAAMLVPILLWALVPIVFARWMLSGMSGRAEPARLRDQKRAALRFLADRGLKGRKRHALPLLLVVGPPGAGKSSLIEQTPIGVALPATIGASRWWVGKDAILVEATVGSGESAQDVFDLIRSVRPRQAVSATLLVISPADLALADETEHRMLAEAIASDLRLLEERLDVRPPVYVLLAKTDMVPGFREFFDRLEPQDRAAPWGFALPAALATTAEAIMAEVDAGFDRLLGSMRARHVEWLSREVDAVRSGRIHGFATQIAALRHQIAPIVSALLPSQAQEWTGAHLRGVFLTSARQEPLTIDALLPDLSQRFALPRIGTLPPDLGMEDENHGYFIAGTIANAILPEAGLAASRRSPWPAVQWLAIALLVGGTFAAGWYIFRVYDSEVRLAARLSEAAAEFPTLPSPSSVENLAAVVAAVRRLDELAVPEAASTAAEQFATMSRKGEYIEAAEAARRAYRANVLLPHLSALLESQLAEATSGNGDLTGLIALSEAVRDAENPAIKDWLEKNVSLVAEDDRDRLVAEGLQSIREAGGLIVDPAFVDAARKMIAYRESLT